MRARDEKESKALFVDSPATLTTTNLMEPMILPGQTIGILGGGQLGRMFAIAARRMGYHVHALDPTPESPTGQVADVEVNADYDDIDAAREFARGVDVVTFEFENIPSETLAAIEEIKPVHPSPAVLDTCRHRIHEKTFLRKHGFPIADFREARGADEVARAIRQLGTPSVILKTADYGYDGKGQVRIDDHSAASAAWSKMGRPVGVVEALVPFDREISVIVARGASGECACYSPVDNVHRNHILDVTTAPAELAPNVAREATKLATAVAEALDVVGVLAVEMFLIGEKLIINELAPRPHNSGHYTFDACVTSQFEQQLRAVCGLPLGDVTQLRPAAMSNLLGDLWNDREPNWAAALRVPNVKLHLYGKRSPKPGRKMGHLTALAETAQSARESALAARRSLHETPHH